MIVDDAPYVTDGAFIIPPPQAGKNTFSDSPSPLKPPLPFIPSMEGTESDLPPAGNTTGEITLDGQKVAISTGGTVPAGSLDIGKIYH